MQKYKCCLIVCWFGILPSYFEIWLKSCETNIDFDYLLFTDAEISDELPTNIRYISFSLKEFKERAAQTISKYISCTKPYRICDFRPMYGVIFEEEISPYDFWGYCDVDVVFGRLNKFVTENILDSYEAIFNGGHFSLLKNSEAINRLYMQKGSLFDYVTVVSNDAIFAFDEITGIQRIARANKVKALYLLPYIETEIRFKQLRSRLDKKNPQYQAFYWEKGDLLRVKAVNQKIMYQEQAYIHLQKRSLSISKLAGTINDSFWIIPTGFEKKEYYGKPTISDIKEKNPYEGRVHLKVENIAYKTKKIFSFLSKRPYQIYVRVLQQKDGINRNQGTLEDRTWKKF